MNPPSSLTPEFRSVYRLFLRAAASATLHSSRGTRALRRQWKPLFQDAALKLGKLHDPQYEVDHSHLRAWMHTWDQTVDTTLSFLYNASHSRGLSNRLTRNISSLYVNVDTRPTAIWQPQLDPNSLEYQIPTDTKSETVKQILIRKRQQIDRQSWNALGEVVRMAEGTAQLSLGRVIKNPR